MFGIRFSPEDIGPLGPIIWFEYVLVPLKSEGKEMLNEFH